MEVYEKINCLLNEKHLTKREFAKRLIKLEPRLKSTGNAPTEKTIYGYLSGKISINIELIPYIVDVLGVTEQELFDESLATKIKFLKCIALSSTENEKEYIKKCIHSEFIHHLIKNKIDTEETYKDENLQKLISLLHFAPKVLVEQWIEKLEIIKKTVLDS
ncbi:MAG: helix-turn-helix transcriptional regulator [Campylobacteraceae bacterium]|nr:helix-turn-helix transcriptional regulator [Campylobacteraceae bacterium]